MNSRYLPKNEINYTELVSILIARIHNLDLTDLQRLIMTSELEIEYRQNQQRSS